MADEAGTVTAEQTPQGEHLIGADDGSRIEEVVVFPEQAYITRQARVSVADGISRLLLEVSAFRVDPDSVQARVHGRGELLGVQYREVPLPVAPQENIRELEEKLRELDRKRTALTDERAALAKQETFLDSIVTFAESQVREDMKTKFPETANLKGVVEFLGENYGACYRRRQELNGKIEELDREIDVVKRKLRALAGPRKKSRKVIEILFMAGEAQEIGIQGSYVVENASWEPVYRVDVPLEMDRVQLTMFSRIRQKTGEEWDGVRLSVSNAVPLKGVDLPRAGSWYLSLPGPPPSAKHLAIRSMMMAPVPEEAAGAEEESAGALDDLFETVPGATLAGAEQKELPHAFEYELPQRTSIGSTGEVTMVPLHTRELNAEFLGYAVPRIDSRVFLVCRTVPDRELLSGTLNVYFGGRFVGGSMLEEKRAGEDLLLNLGVERGVSLRREKVQDKVRETFFRMVDRHFVPRGITYRIVIENLKDQPVRVWLLDAVPVSRTDRIQVKKVELDPEPTEKDHQKREGVLFWDLQVPPKGTREVNLDFVVAYPKNRRPLGL